MEQRRELEITLPASWDTAAAALAACARALGDPRSPAALHAASGLAFRISTDRRLTPAGPLAYPWREVLTVAAERLGCRWRLAAADPGEPLWTEARDEAFALATAGALAGRPTLLFGVHGGAFGLVRGVDPAADALIVSGVLDGTAPPLLSRAALGGNTGMLFALQLTARLAIDPAVAARATLRAAIRHGRGDAPTEGGVAIGAAAWQLVCTALASGDVDPSGLALLAQLLAEARAAVAGWLPTAATTLALDLAPAERAARRAAGMLAEAARLLPFPPPATGMLTTSLREQACDLFAEAARAEAESLASLEIALAASERAIHDLRVIDLDAAHLPSLFACVQEIPIAGLQGEAATCRERLGLAVGGKLLYRGERLIGHILWAPLEEAGYPVAARGRRWFVFCPWLESGLRGRGLGARLFSALDDAARAAGIDGLLTLATSIEVFLHHRGYEHHGFVEVDRRGDSRLLERRLTDLPSEARLQDPPAPPPGGPLQVIVRHGYNCPLLLRVRRDAASAARAL
ncbi:MAG: hypothetical protein EXR72_22250, partial [Myxococcales bacterium]|nr:hypothetical protein [Myxococcales bacterium]